MSDASPTGGTGVGRLFELYTAALDVPELDRARFVRDAANEDGLADEVLALLALEDVSGPLDVPLPLLAAELLAGDGGSDGNPSDVVNRMPSPGSSIGPFRIIEELGRGGMGIVFLAERADGAYEHRVALKVMSGGIPTPELERRFLRERQILARLDHPLIARLLHGGVTPRGDPYIAMQLVEGEPITRWARERGLRIEERLRLFRKVCEAVGYAHRQLIVHRDLKPSNILVTRAGEVRLLDFGIARLLTEDGSPDAATRTGLLLLTPEYSAPELLRGEPATVATDIYALGLVLYELLTDRRARKGGSASLADLVRRSTEEVSPPSRAEGLEASRTRRLRGDLDAIVTTALRLDPVDRYSSVEALDEDVRRYLDRQPIRARAPTRLYRAARFVRRHTFGVGAAAAIALSLVGGIAGTGLMAANVRREAARTEAVRSFLLDLWEAADPIINEGRVPTARDLLDRGAQRIDALAASAGPEIRVEVLSTLGFLYYRLGDYPRSIEIFAQAVDDARAGFGDDPRTGSAMNGLAQSLLAAGEAEAAEEAANESIQMLRGTGAADSILAGSYSTLGGILGFGSRHEEARQAHLIALELDRRSLGARSAAVATDFNNLGAIARRQGRLEDAARYFAEALAIRRERLGPLHPDVAVSLGQLAGLRRELGDLEEAENLQREALGIRRQVLGPEHPDVAISLSELALTLEAAGRFDAADSLGVEVLDLRRRIHGERHPLTVTAMNNLATVRFRQGRYDWAADVQREVVDIWREDLGIEDTRTLTAVTNLGVMSLRAGDLPEADRHLSEALRERTRLLGVDHPAVAVSMRWLSELRRAQGRNTEAERLGREALLVYESNYPPGHPRIAEAELSVGAALVAAGRPAEALEMLRSALDAREATEAPVALDIAEARIWLGLALVRSGERDEGRLLLEEGLDTYGAAGRTADPPAILASEELD